ncbi:outer membrane protein [Aureimonas leprariae]|uniref:Porin family protein n=1 Tax=Plantimonas leprariae TaxID=2615207 RepID=A0A7V7TVI3_9HYPH|nr:outer membrane beta-barrel protein [Aureimonas leprariae]KAB0678027.1 porin family protein [Aureimonas leprariae]
MSTLRKTIAPLAAGIALALAAGSAYAADLIEQAPLVPVEVGSGWYLRGDLSYDFKSDLDADYGMKYEDKFGTKYSKDDKFDDYGLDDNIDYGAGFGYQFTDYFRGDLTAHYWKTDLKYDGKDLGDTLCLSTAIAGYACDDSGDANAKAWELMANAYLDLGTFAGFTPYVGGGVGAVHVKYDDIKVAGHCSVGGVTCGRDVDFGLEGQGDWRFAYALTAGAAYDLTQNLKLDVGYRYLDVDSGDMYRTSLTGGDYTQKDGGFHRHTIQAGLRYSLF